MLKTYYLLAKPGIILGNLITTIAGFALASKGQFDLSLFLALSIGIGGVIGSACVFNNYIDRESDQKMARTKNRPLAKGSITEKRAIFYAFGLGLIGFLTLFFFTNLLSTFIAAIGFFIYVALYSFWKHHTRYATAVGSIAGALPPVIGYCAVSNTFDLGAALLFILLVLWQMPHFFSIAIYRLEDYTAASIPVMPVVRGIPATKVRMALYIAAFLLAVLLLFISGYTGYRSFFVAAALGMIWFVLCLKGFKSNNDQLWARQMFRHSLLLITILCLSLSLDSLIR